MANEERTQEILNYLRSHKHASVDELASELYVSTATIRRDLTRMQSAGLLERSHGGATLKETANEALFALRSIRNANEKLHTASLALRHLPSFNTIFIDDSSTCLFLAEKIDFTNKTVVTNSLQLAMYLLKCHNAHVLLPGGDVTLSGKYAVTGSYAVRTIESMRFDLMIGSCAALDQKNTYERSMEAATLKRTAFEQSDVRMLLADSTKIGTSFGFSVARLHEYDKIFTNAKHNLLEEHGIDEPNVVHS